jgi:uncharacterized protein YjiS (DUF1127 family)
MILCGETLPCKFCTTQFAAVHYIGLVETTTTNRKDIIMFEVLKSRISTWKRYNRTVSELAALSNRELSDLGIARGDISRIAREAVRS